MRADARCTAWRRRHRRPLLLWCKTKADGGRYGIYMKVVEGGEKRGGGGIGEVISEK